MITYNGWGDAEGCTHEHDGREVGADTAEELEKVITESVVSLRDRIRYLEGERATLAQQLEEATVQVPSLHHKLYVAHEFIRYVLDISAHGPRTSLEDLQKKGLRALAGEQRTTSAPPRRIP